MHHLRGFLGEPGRRHSMSRAAAFLKETMGEDEYRKLLQRTGFTHLSQAVKLFDEFELKSEGYYIELTA